MTNAISLRRASHARFKLNGDFAINASLNFDWPSGRHKTQQGNNKITTTLLRPFNSVSCYQAAKKCHPSTMKVFHIVMPR